MSAPQPDPVEIERIEVQMDMVTALLTVCHAFRQHMPQGEIVEVLAHTLGSMMVITDPMTNPAEIDPAVIEHIKRGIINTTPSRVPGTLRAN